VFLRVNANIPAICLQLSKREIISRSGAVNYDEFAQTPTEAMVLYKKIIKDDEVWNNEDSKCEKEKMDLIYNMFLFVYYFLLVCL
jgi:hypothetical protein